MTATHDHVPAEGQSTTGRPRKQEQEGASAEVTEIAPGVLRSQLPIEFTGLGHVNMYIFEDDRGVAVVDPGLPGVSTFEAIQDRLRQVGVPLSRVHTVVVTHSHPDHFGSAGKIVEETGADVVTDARFRLWWEPDSGDVELELATPPSLDDLKARVDRPTPWGSPASGSGQSPSEEIQNSDRARDWEHFRSFRPTVRLEDGAPFLLGGREWQAIYTPGHTDDHLCLFDPTDGILISGDHVLPTITPHISGMFEGDTLGRYLRSLDEVAALPAVRTVLPAHGHPFHDLPGRVDEIKEHHEGRLDRLRVISHDLGWATVPQLAQQLFHEKNWGSMADSETFAHLERLRLTGQADRREEAGQLLYLIPT